MVLANKVIYQNGAIREFEKPEVCEAIKVANANRWTVCLSPTEWDEREARLEKEYEKNTKAPGHGEEQSKEGDLKAATKMFGAQALEIMRLTAENAELRETIDKMKEGNPALKEALKESATKFNDALLNEQGKKIKRLGKEIARLNKIIHKKNLKIDEMRKESSRHLEGKMKMFGENFDLEQELKDKNAVLSDVAEELRLSKIREKNLTEVCQKYVKEVEDLREKLAEKDDELTESKKRIEWVRNASKEYCDYGVAANEFIKELAGLYVLASNNGNIDVEMLERCKNYQTYGFPANCNRETKKEINDIARGKTKVVGVDIAEEGADHSGVTVLCGKDCIDDIIKKMK